MSLTTARTSLSADGPKPSDDKPRDIHDFEGLAHPTYYDKLSSVFRAQPCRVEPLRIEVEHGPDGFVSGLLHLPSAFVKGTSSSQNRSAVILLSGAGGGVVGPSSIYLGMADKLASCKGAFPASDSIIGIPLGIITVCRMCSLQWRSWRICMRSIGLSWWAGASGVLQCFPLLETINGLLDVRRLQVRRPRRRASADSRRGRCFYAMVQQTGR